VDAAAEAAAEAAGEKALEAAAARSFRPSNGLEQIIFAIGISL